MYCPKPFRFNRLSVYSPKGKYSPSDDNDCSARISESEEDNCSARISRKSDEIKPSPTDDKLPPQFQTGDRQPTNRAEQNPLITEPDYKPEKDGQFTIFPEDEPPDPDDFETKEDYLAAWVEWESQYPELAEAIARRETETIPAEQKPQTETIKPPKTRNTKPGRGSRPKQVSCNVKRNGSKDKSPNSYWLYQFSFKVEGRYYNRSCSIPSLKVEQVIWMWESKQYSWRDIVDFIGKNPDKIIEKVRDKNE